MQDVKCEKVAGISLAVRRTCGSTACVAIYMFGVVHLRLSLQRDGGHGCLQSPDWWCDKGKQAGSRQR